MSIKRNRKLLNKAKNSKEYKILLMKEIYHPYYDEGWNYYPKYRKGFKNSKQILHYQKRMYASWKHNRLTQYKEF